MIATKNTADLIVQHAEAHLEQRSACRSPSFWRAASAPLIFGTAGLLVVGSAFQLLSFSVRANERVTAAANAQNYAVQEVSELLPDYAAAREVVHAAASAQETSRLLGAIGFALIIFVLWYLHRGHGLFESSNPDFVIHKIK